MLLMAAVFVSIPIAAGGLGLSSDTLNHHLYLGWVGQAPRFDRDFMAASYQGYQYPYAYWPVYRLAASGLSGVTAGVVLAVIQLLAVPAVWLIARACIPGRTAFDVAMRLMASVLAFMTSVVLLNLGTTANDLLAAIPFVWAIAVAVLPLDPAASGWCTPRRAAGWSGVFAGAAIALKLSHGPLAIVLPLLWAAPAGKARERLLRVVLAGGVTTAVFLLLYAHWGWQLWRLFGNPVHPAYDDLFAPLRAAVGWQP